MSGLDPELVRYAVATARREGFLHVRLRQGDDKFSAVLDPEGELAEAYEETVGEDLAMAASAPKESVIKAPVVGYFQDSAGKFEVGSKVTVGDIVGEIVSLDIANDVLAKCEGEIVEVFVKSGEPVEYGQTLATVRAE